MALHKYSTTAVNAFKQQLSLRAQIYGRLFLYITIVYLFYQVFQSVEATLTRVWYLAVTEWIMLSTPPLALQIEQDIRTGQIAYFLLRPMNYLSFRLTEMFGIFVFRYAMLGLVCIAFCFILTNHIPNSLFEWALGTVIGILGVFLYTLILTLIGILSFWITEVHPLLYLNLTATFCFGGLIVPLSFYSESFRRICYLTPYPWILSWPAETITNTVTLSQFSKSFLIWSGWVFLLIILILMLYQRILKSFTVEGG